MIGNFLLAGFAFLSIGEFFSDMMLVLKIFVLLAIMSFVFMHLGKGPLAIVVIVGFAWVMLFSPWTWFFEGAYVLMMLLTLGVAGIFIDLFFVFPGFAAGGHGEQESKLGSQKDVNERIKLFHHPPGGGGRLPPPM